MFNKSKKGYHKLVVEDPDIASIITEGRPIVTYPTPSALGSYTKEGLEYRDIMGNVLLVPTEKIPEFLHHICAAELPWTQRLFSAIFYSPNQTPMPGLDLFEQVLQNNPAALVDFKLIQLGARAAQIQIAQVGLDSYAMLCDDSKALLVLYQQLSDDFKDFQNKVTRLPESRHRLKVFHKMEADFNARWEERMQPYIAKYKDDWDSYNVLLNLLAIASIVGIAGLICKNVVRLYQGKNLSLFQFDSARSKSLDLLEQLKPGDFPRPSIELQNFFTQNSDDAFHTVQELSQHVENLKQELVKFKSSGSKSELNELHRSLAKAVNDFATEIQSLQGSAQEVDKREVAEALFMNNWHSSVACFFDTKEEVASYPPELKAALVDIHYIAEQLEHEFQNSERFALYASPKKR